MAIQVRSHNVKPAFMFPWSKRTLYIGPLTEPVGVAYGAATLVVSLGGPLRVSHRKGFLTCYSVLIPAGYPVNLDAGSDIVVICHLDVLGEDYRHLQGCFAEQAGVLMTNAREENDLRHCFAEIYRQPSDSDKTFLGVDALLAYTVERAGTGPMPGVDPRVIAVVSYIKQHFQENIPVEGLAEHARLSVPHLVALFKQQTGVPIRRFRLWHRIYESVLTIGEGESLTDAALGSGFFDSPHYTHYFNAMWGMSPGRLFVKGIGADIVLPSGKY